MLRRFFEGDSGPVGHAADGMVGEPIAALDNRGAVGRGQVHLAFELGGKRIRYAYIRKNGCSAFKTAMGFAHDVRIGLIEPYQRCGLLRRRYHATIFVWRDPLERIVSLYRKKIIDDVNSEDIRRRLRAFAGGGRIDFDRFVDFCCRAGDPHCLPQAAHLKPIRYTHAIPLARLHEAMTGIVGPEAAAPFAQRVNQSRQTPIMISDTSREHIRHHYSQDYRLIEQIRAAHPCERRLGPKQETHHPGIVEVTDASCRAIR